MHLVSPCTPSCLLKEAKRVWEDLMEQARMGMRDDEGHACRVPGETVAELSGRASIRCSFLVKGLIVSVDATERLRLDSIRAPDGSVVGDVVAAAAAVV